MSIFSVVTGALRLIGVANKISTTNSTATPLAANGVFTGTFEDVSGYATVSVLVKSNVASAANGLLLEWSSDGTNVDDTDNFSLMAGGGKYFSFPAEGKFLRVSYTNGSTIQAAFRLQTKYQLISGKGSSHRVKDGIVEEDDAELVKAVVAGKKPDGTFDNVNLNDQSAMHVITPDRSGSGSIAGSGQSVIATISGASTITFAMSGTFVATIGVEGSADGITWYPIVGTVIGQETEFVVGFRTTPGLWVIPCGGFQQIRLTAVSYTSGTATVVWNAGSGTSALQVHNLDYAGLRAQVRIPDVAVTTVNVTSTSSVAASTDGRATISFTLIGTWVGTVVFEATNDATPTWIAVQALSVGASSLVSSTTGNGTFVIPCAGYTQVRIRATAFSSGTLFVTSNASALSNVVQAISPAGLLALDATLVAQSVVDNAPFTDGTTRVVPAGFIFDETAGAALTENDAGAARVNANRAQIVTLEDGTTRGQRAAINASGALSVNQTQVNGTAILTGGIAGSLGVGGLAADGASPTGNPVLVAGYDGTLVQQLFVDPFGRIQIAPTTKNTYAASTAAFTPAAAATDVFTISGSASKTVKVLSLVLSGVQTAGGNIATVSLVKRSAVNTGGTAVASTKVPHDSSIATATAVVQHYTANPTGLGAAVGTVYNPRASVPAAGNVGSPASILQYAAPDPSLGEPITLRGTAEVLAISLGGVTPTGAAGFQVTALWTEE